MKVQQENFTKLLEESASHKADLDDLLFKNDSLQKKVSHERSEQQVLMHSQELLLGKLKALQDQNDSLSVEVEGVKSKLDYYTNENISLELRLRDMESNRQELKQEIRRLESRFRDQVEKGIYYMSNKYKTKFLIKIFFLYQSENIKEKLLNKLSTVTFEPWESDLVVSSSYTDNDNEIHRTTSSSSNKNNANTNDKNNNSVPKG